MRQIDRRLDEIIFVCDVTGISLDLAIQAIGYIDERAFRAVVDNPSLLPRYIQSSVSP